MKYFQSIAQNWHPCYYSAVVNYLAYMKNWKMREQWNEADAKGFWNENKTQQ